MNRVIVVIALVFLSAGCTRSATSRGAGEGYVSFPTEQYLTAASNSVGTGTEGNPSSSSPTGIQDPYSTSAPVHTIEPGLPPEAFSDARIKEVGFIQPGILIVVIEVSQDVRGEYRAEIDGQPYTCIRQPEYPRNLYCSGSEPEAASAHLRLYPADANMLLFEADISRTAR